MVAIGASTSVSESDGATIVPFGWTPRNGGGAETPTADT